MVNFVNSFLTNAPYFLGTYILRKTNDNKLDSTLSYLILNDDNNIKFKTINLKGIIATKISRTGTIKFNKKNIKYNYLNYKVNNIKFTNDFDLIINFNNVNKYSYSYFGIEFPEIKYKQISDYNIERKIRVQQKDFTLFIKDYETNFYYIFDLTQDLNNKKLPYIEIPFNTLLFTNIIGYITHILLVNIFHLL